MPYSKQSYGPLCIIIILNVIDGVDSSQTSELVEQMKTAKIVSQSTLFAANGLTVCASYVSFSKSFPKKMSHFVNTLRCMQTTTFTVQ